MEPSPSSSGHKRTNVILWSIAAAVGVLLAFGAGMFVGYRRGIFSSRFGEDYYENFYGGPPQGPMVTPAMNQHGATGVVIEVASSSIAAEGNDGNEQSIAVGTGTVIRKMNQTISLNDVVPGEQIIVIGDPNGDGQIQARFIRIFPASSSLPTQSPQN